MQPDLHTRPAVLADLLVLRELIDASFADSRRRTTLPHKWKAR